MNSPFSLPISLYEEIIAHARAGAPEEICGILRGRQTHAFALLRARNIAGERIENYVVDPQTLLRQFEFEKAGDEMVAIYHSHPVSPAYPSATDAWNAAYPDAYYLICSLENDSTQAEGAPVLRAFRLTTHWLELDWDALRAVLPFYETRPGLFAWYQAADTPLPDPLSISCSRIERPFYLVYSQGYDESSDHEGRLVTVQEHPLTVFQP
jgi:proteasome lid subunit RPN8/RPN11